MKAVLQIVSTATVYADGILSGNIDRGLHVLLGVEAEDSALDAELLCEKPCGQGMMRGISVAG